MKRIKKSATRIRYEKRQRFKRNRILKKIFPIILSVVLLGMVGMISYGIWYNYIPTEVSAEDMNKTIPVKYTVIEGDTLDGIAKRFYKEYGYDRPCSFEWVIMKKNNIHNANYICTGDVILLPRIVSDIETILIPE